MEHLDGMVVVIQKLYKCLATSRLSKPAAGAVSLETGMEPLSLFILRSSHDSCDRLPMEAGIGPLKLLEFKDLSRDKANNIQ